MNTFVSVLVVSERSLTYCFKERRVCFCVYRQKGFLPLTCSLTDKHMTWHKLIFLKSETKTQCHLSMQVFVSVSVWFHLKVVFSFSFSFGSAVSPMKAMEWLANQWPSHPVNLESSFSRNYFTRPRETSVSCEDMGAHYKCVCLGLMLWRQELQFFTSQEIGFGVRVLWSYISNIYIA